MFYSTSDIVLSGYLCSAVPDPICITFLSLTSVFCSTRPCWVIFVRWQHIFYSTRFYLCYILASGHLYSAVPNSVAASLSGDNTYSTVPSTMCVTSLSVDICVLQYLTLLRHLRQGTTHCLQYWPYLCDILVSGHPCSAVPDSVVKASSSRDNTCSTVPDYLCHILVNVSRRRCSAVPVSIVSMSRDNIGSTVQDPICVISLSVDICVLQYQTMLL